jgi:hypothetical protein
MTPWGGWKHLPPYSFLCFSSLLYAFFSLIGDQKTQVKYLIPIG